MPSEPGEPSAEPTPAAATTETPPPAKKRAARAKSAAPGAESPAKPETPATDAAPKKSTKREEPKAPRRAPVDERTRRLLALRRSLDARRPIFGRQAANRYYRIGRDGAWRRPRGLQSKQRRHYGYRAKIVRVGYRSPARVRGLVPSGFRPVLVRTGKEIDQLDAKTEAAIIARTVGTRRRLVLEELALKRGVRVLNPIAEPEEET